MREVIVDKPLVFLKKQRIFRDKLLRWFLALAFVSMLTVIVILLWRLRPHDFVLPSGFMTGVGFTNPGSWYALYGYWFFSFLVTVANSILAMLILEKSRITSFFLLTGAVIINIFTIVVVFTLLSEVH